MSAVHVFVTWVLPALFVLIAGVTVALVFRGCSAKALDGLPGWWLWPLLLVYAGDAAFGEHRPMWERGCKAAAVTLLVVAYVSGWLRVRRARRPGPAA